MSVRFITISSRVSYYPFSAMTLSLVVYICINLATYLSTYLPTKLLARLPVYNGRVYVKINKIDDDISIHPLAVLALPRRFPSFVSVTFICLAGMGIIIVVVVVIHAQKSYVVIPPCTPCRAHSCVRCLTINNFTDIAPRTRRGVD